MAPRTEVIQRAEPRELALLVQGRALIAESRSVDDLKKIRDKAEAIRAYFRQQKESLELQNEAAEIKLRAERRAGELLAGLELNGGDRKSDSHRDRVKLEDFEVTHSQSSRWQLEAKLPEEKFVEWVAETKEAGGELTSSGLRRAAKSATKGDAKDPEEMTVVQATDRLLDLLDRVLEWWPEGHHQALGKTLIALGEEVEETGRFP